MFEVLAYIHTNISSQLNIEEVSARFGYSKWHFCRKFRNFSGMTFGEYVRTYRVRLAAIDIIKNKKITDTALSYGYESISGFNKAFLKEFGCFPREYKKTGARMCALLRKKEDEYVQFI